MSQDKKGKPLGICPLFRAAQLAARVRDTPLRGLLSHEYFGFEVCLGDDCAWYVPAGDGGSGGCALAWAGFVPVRETT